MSYVRAPWLPAILTVLFALAVTPARSGEPDVYPTADQAKIDLRSALAASAATHKRVILE